MITTYLLKNCKYCEKLLKYLTDNPNVNLCLIMISKKELPYIKYHEPRIKEFPVSFLGSPKVNGLPHKNSKMITGSTNILQSLINKFGAKSTHDLTGSNIDIDYLDNNSGNIKSLNNIRKHRNNCFGRACHIMDRPYGPSDNQYILQGYQPSCAIPYRSDLPIKDTYLNHFGTTPGTKAWQLERQQWQCPKILIDDSNYSQDLKGNTDVKLNSPMTYSNDYINRMRFYDNNNTGNNFGNKLSNKLSNKFGNKLSNKNTFVQAPVNSTEPFLTYAAGGNGVSRITGNNYLREQVPIQRQNKDAFISGNIKNYVNKHSNSQKLLYDGLNSDWSINAQGINAQGINKYGKPHFSNNSTSRLSPPRPGPPKIPTKEINQNPYKIANKGQFVQTVFDSNSGNSGIAQHFYKFPQNGNVFGKVKEKEKVKKEKSRKTKMGNVSNASNASNASKKSSHKVKFTSPLGIEISF